MSENNTPVIPQEWITTKTLKTVSGAALCCWLTTVFFDLVCFTPINSARIHSLLILIVTSLCCLGLAIYKVASGRGKKTKAIWMLIIPNAMLIYVHALGFQVASKELAMRAIASEVQKETNIQAGMLSFLGVLAKQTSWIPNLELINQTNKFNEQLMTLKNNNKSLEDSIIHLNHLYDFKPSNIPIVIKQDSTDYYSKLYKNCAHTNLQLKSQIDSTEALVKKLKENLSMTKPVRDRSKDSMLFKSIEAKNLLINKWNRLMGNAGMNLQRSEIERIMNGHMGDENYYRQLFKPIQLP